MLLAIDDVLARPCFGNISGIAPEPIQSVHCKARQPRGLSSTPVECLYDLRRLRCLCGLLLDLTARIPDGLAAWSQQCFLRVPQLGTDLLRLILSRKVKSHQACWRMKLAKAGRPFAKSTAALCGRQRNLLAVTYSTLV